MSFLSQKIKTIIIVILLSLFFFLSTGTVREGDLFWHIKTGEWIWHNKAIPSEDPFTYTFQRYDPVRPGYMRQEIVLRGYWLGQVFYYLVYRLFQIEGIIVFRALMITLVLLILYLFTRSLGVSYELSIAFLIFQGLWFMNAGDRPQLFSFVIFPVVLFLVDSLKGARDPSRAFLLIALMLLWPNLHGGYVTGIAVIALYLLGVLLRRPFDLRSCIIYVGAILVTLLNPNTYKTLLGVIQEMSVGVQARFIAEMLSPLEVFKEGFYYPTFWLSLLITAVVLLVALIERVNKKGSSLTVERIAILLLFIFTSLRHQRMIHFFMLSLPFIALELERLLKDKRMNKIVKKSLLFLGIVLIFLAINPKNILNADLKELFPVGCVNFLNETSPEGNLFNWSDWGGYLMLYAPQFKVFHDGRRLMDDVEISHNGIVNGLNTPIMGIPAWRAYLDSYKIEVLVIPPVHPLFGQFTGLVRELYTDSEFSLVYADKNCLIYLRRGGPNDLLIHKYELPKELGIIKAIQRLHTYRTESERLSKIRLIATLYRLIGRHEVAKEYEKMLGQ